MILDSRLEFCDATSLSSSTATDSVILGNVVDLASATGAIGGTNTLTDAGNGKPLYFCISIDTTVAGVSGTTQFQLATDSTTNLATSRTNHITSPAFTTAQMVAGFTWCTALPPSKTYERYMGVWTTQATATITAGKVNCFLAYEPPTGTNVVFADGL